jgi:hypothetical protein
MLWQHPIDHIQVETREAIAISAHEAVVVYGKEAEVVRRRVVRGPARFVPASGEWMHQFSWHGADPQQPKRKIPRALQFQCLRIIPDQMYVEVETVRTADDALLAVSFMIFFELIDIEHMLDQTHDPIADLINALTADVIEFAAARSFEAFKADTEALNELETFAQLQHRCAHIGYRIAKVVYRGYVANAALQAMHDHAIEARTGLRLESETEAQAQDLADVKIAREGERARQAQALAVEAERHAAAIKRLRTEEHLIRDDLEADARRRHKEAEHEQGLRHRHARDAQKLTLAEGMHAAGVDLTRWFVARYQHPDRLIRIEGQAAGLDVKVGD